jgi:hypothetical protein
MIARVFDLPGLLIILGIALLAFIVPVIVGAVRGESGVLKGVEALILAVLGGLLARIFISAILSAANDSPGAGLAVGWGFFIVPGLIDTFAGHPVLTTPAILMMLGGIVGAFTGMMAGIYQIYDWTGLGYLGFPLDVTWALAGNSVGALMHLINIGWGDHGDETRKNQHRYASGFGLRYDPKYAFTQGCVMSNLDVGPPDEEGHGSDLYRHERTHVWQNRAFGPLYTLTYVAWILVWVIPAVIVGIVVRGISGIVKGPNNWCYFNNPWEVWAYAVQGSARTDINGVDDEDRKMIWPAHYVIAWAIPFFMVALGLSLFTVYEVWLTPAPAAQHSTASSGKGASHSQPTPPPKPKPNH